MDSAGRSLQESGTSSVLVIILQYGVFITHQRAKIFKRRFAKECHLEAFVLGLEDQWTGELSSRVHRSEDVVLVVDPGLDRNEVERKVQSTFCNSLTKRLASDTVLVVRFHQSIFKSLLPPVEQTEIKVRLAGYVLSRESQNTLKKRPAVPAVGNSGATKKARRSTNGASLLPTNKTSVFPTNEEANVQKGAFQAARREKCLESMAHRREWVPVSFALRPRHGQKECCAHIKDTGEYKYSKANKSLQQRHQELAIPRLLGALRGLDFKVTLENLDRLAGVPYIGKSYVRIIAEILQTGSFTRLKLLQSDKKSNCCLDFVKIFWDRFVPRRSAV